MTDISLDQPIAPQSISDATQARVDQLRRNRADRTAAPVRRHPAQGARIAAGGLALASMFGIVGAMGFANRSTSAAPSAVVPTPAPQVVVVIHRTSQSDASSTIAPATPASATGLTPGPTVAAPAAPTPLTAQPVIQQAPAAPTPIATTSGSR